MVKIRRSQLIGILAEQNKACPITITALTDAQAKKTDNPFGRIFKMSRVNGFTGFNYENSVNRQREREGNEKDFEAQARSWGERINNCLVKKGEEYYLTIKVEKSLMKPVYMYYSNGLQIISRETVAKFLRPAKSSPNQGLDREVIYRNYKLESIVKICINGQTYKVV